MFVLCSPPHWRSSSAVAKWTSRRGLRLTVLRFAVNPLMVALQYTFITDITGAVVLHPADCRGPRSAPGLTSPLSQLRPCRRPRLLGPRNRPDPVDLARPGNFPRLHRGSFSSETVLANGPGRSPDRGLRNLAQGFHGVPFNRTLSLLDALAIIGDLQRPLYRRGTGPGHAAVRGDITCDRGNVSRDGGQFVPGEGSPALHSLSPDSRDAAVPRTVVRSQVSVRPNRRSTEFRRLAARSSNSAKQRFRFRGARLQASPGCPRLRFGAALCRARRDQPATAAPAARFAPRHVTTLSYSALPSPPAA